MLILKLSPLESASMSWSFSAELCSSGGLLVPELVIPSGKPIRTVDSMYMSW
jgi:hypothetical protein